MLRGRPDDGDPFEGGDIMVPLTDIELIETAEAKPFWHPVGEMPYGRMWADDEHWMPRLLAGEKFRGWFEFDGDRMEWFRMEAA